MGPAARGGAIKNVIAVAAGISDGLVLGSSARAALITRGLAEMMRLGTAIGAGIPCGRGGGGGVRSSTKLTLIPVSRSRDRCSP